MSVSELQQLHEDNVGVRYAHSNLRGLIWSLGPRRQCLHMYRSLTDLDVLTVQDTLTGGEVLPGFQVLVAELFDS